MGDPTKHALFSPSGAERWFACPGSVAMEFGAPDNGNEYSAEGTCAHGVARMCLVEGKPAAAYIGRRVEVGPHETYEFREDMAEPVQCYVDFVNSLPGEKHYEVRVPISHVTFEEGAEGTADAVVLSEDLTEISIIDLKFGQGVRVSAEANKQGMLYALGALAKFDVMGSVERIRIVIHQPRIHPEPSVWTCSLAELRAFEARASEHAKTATIAFEFRENWLGKSEEYLNVTDEGCLFCKAAATCPARAKHVEAAVGAGFEMIVKSAPTPLMQMLDGAALGVRMRATNLVEDWIKAVRAEVERRLLASQEVPGYKLVTGRQGNRAWTDETAAEDLLRKQFRLPIEEAYSLKLISPTQAERVLEKTHPKRWAKCQPLIHRAEGKPSVAPESDTRPAISIKPVKDDFDEGADLV